MALDMGRFPQNMYIVGFSKEVHLFGSKNGEDDHHWKHIIEIYESNHFLGLIVFEYPPYSDGKK
jgi:hypothetical protein